MSRILMFPRNQPEPPTDCREIIMLTIAMMTACAIGVGVILLIVW